MKKDWWAPLTGIAFVVFVVVSFIVMGEPPDAKDPVAKIVDHYNDNKDSIEIGAALVVPGAALLVFFIAVVGERIRALAPDSILPRTALAGAVIIAVGAGIDSTISFAIAEAADDIDPVGVQTLQAFWDNDFLPFAIGQVLVFLSLGIAIVRYGGLPKWMGWIAILFGIVGMTPIGFFAFMGGAVWIIIASVVMTMANRAQPAT